MTGGGGADTFVIATGANAVTIGGSGNFGTITGYDVITDFATGSDTLDLQGTAVAAANTTGTNGTDSTLTISGADGEVARNFERHNHVRRRQHLLRRR